MSQAISLNQSTWASKLKAMGPGILMATAAVGGSHIVSSTQAGGSYGWSLLLLVILANVFKYHFSVLVLNTQLILERLWLKVMPKEENSISGFSLFSMSFRLWSTQLVSPFCAQLSSPVPSQ